MLASLASSSLTRSPSPCASGSDFVRSRVDLAAVAGAAGAAGATLPASTPRMRVIALCMPSTVARTCDTRCEKPGRLDALPPPIESKVTIASLAPAAAASAAASSLARMSSSLLAALDRAPPSSTPTRAISSMSLRMFATRTVAVSTCVAALPTSRERSDTNACSESSAASAAASISPFDARGAPPASLERPCPSAPESDLQCPITAAQRSA
mmetsp:Transcript_2873/g.11587  ORF Transcript_2873/g.11587 Transcript_2873/m.11587 type:complete len:212 (-) Transcript_2873:1246-1881(-)